MEGKSETKTDAKQDGKQVYYSRAHPAIRPRYLTPFTVQQMLEDYEKVWTSVCPSIENDIKEVKGYPFYDLNRAIERESFHKFIYIATDPSGIKKPDDFFHGIKSLIFHKSLFSFKRQFGDDILFHVFPCVGDDDEKKYKDICIELKIERQSVPKIKLQSFREKLIQTFGQGERLSITQIKSNWKADVDAVKTWIELPKERRLTREAPWLWWCMSAKSQGKILRVYTVNKQLGIDADYQHRRFRDNVGFSWNHR